MSHWKCEPGALVLLFINGGLSEDCFYVAYAKVGFKDEDECKKYIEEYGWRHDQIDFIAIAHVDALVQHEVTTTHEVKWGS